MTKAPPKAAPTVPPRAISMQPDPAYWQALGRFIEAFASTETTLFNYLIALVDVPHAVGRALFSGDHVDTLIGTVKRVALVTTTASDVKDTLEPALTQFKIIGSARNSIVHFVSMVTSDKGRVSSNITRARSAEHIKEFRASVETLNEMTTDLERISQSFVYCLLTSPGGGRPPLPQHARAYLTSQLPALNVAWLYIPPQDHQK
jgi:hypothetical protein